MSSSDDYRSRLIAARERLGLSRREMAKRLLTPRATYEQWEDGKRRTPGIAVVASEKIAGVPVGRFGPLPTIDRAKVDAACDLIRRDGIATTAAARAVKLIGPDEIASFSRVGGLIRKRCKELGITIKYDRRQGSQLSRVFALCDGTRTTTDIALALGLTSGSVNSAIQTLKRRGDNPNIVRQRKPKSVR